MKVTVKRVFFDQNGLHRVGEVAEVEKFDAELMELVAENKKPEKKTKETK